jgi:hypothetical protein
MAGAPVAGMPVGGPENCPSCYGSGDPGVAYSPPRVAPIAGYPAPGPGVPGPGVPIISGPMPLYPGPTVEPIPPGGGRVIPSPMPPGKPGN